MSDKLTYIFDRDKFNQRIKDYSNIGMVYYPLKTNSNPEVVKAINFLNAAGTKINYEADSVEQIRILTQANSPESRVDSSRILYSNLAKTDTEIAESIELGVNRFVIDEVSTFRVIEELMGDKPTTYIVRLDLGNFFDDLGMNYLKLGTSLETFRTIQDYTRKRGKSVGLSFYAPRDIDKKVGSPTRQATFTTIINLIEQYLKDNNIQIDFLDIGGGLLLEDLNSSEMQKRLESFKKGQEKCQTIIESGTGIVGDCFDLETEIKRVKEKTASIEQLEGIRLPATVVYMAAGIYKGLLDSCLEGRQYNFALNERGEEPIQIEPLGEQFKKGYRLIFLSGSVPDSKDSIGYFQIPSESDISTSDTITVKNVGAYSQALMTRFINEIDFKTVLVSDKMKEKERGG